MLIEVLEVDCPPERREAFMARDADIWTAALAQQPGFIAKEVWTGRDDRAGMIIVIRWETLDHWKAFPSALAQELDQKMGDLLMPLTCHTYLVGRSTDSAVRA
jgi:uncharacterized protein (TIGR03792 family)